MGAFNYNNPLIVSMVRLANMMIVSFYWVLCCIPVVTVLPACAALYHCVTRVVMAGGSGVTRDFFRSFKAALRPGVALTVIVEIVAALVYLGIRTGIQVIITVRQSQAVDTLGEQVHFKGNAHCGECLPQGEGVAGIVAVGLPDEKGRSDRHGSAPKAPCPTPCKR